MRQKIAIRQELQKLLQLTNENNEYLKKLDNEEQQLTLHINKFNKISGKYGKISKKNLQTSNVLPPSPPY